MGLFSKKEEVPELPPAPTLPELPRKEEKKDLPELPTFPQTSQNETLNQEIVKSAVSDSEIPAGEEVKVEFPALPERPINSVGQIPQNTPPVVESAIPEPPKPVIAPVVQVPPKEPEVVPKVPKAQEKSNDPIFVRIDKFQSSQESFEKILEKVGSIEKTIEKIKAVKGQEEEELSKWSIEVEQLKSRLSDIDDHIFSQA